MMEEDLIIPNEILPSDDPNAANSSLQQQPSEEQEEDEDEDEDEDDETCAVCLEPLRYQILGDTAGLKTRIPIADRFLFHPSQCRQFHSFHLSCAKSAAKTEALEHKTSCTEIAIHCPICRTGYPIEDVRRLLPHERLLSLKLQVCPIDETSEYDVVLWEKYDPNCRYPRNPRDRHKSTRHMMTRRIPSSILPLSSLHSCRQCQQQQQQQQPSADDDDDSEETTDPPAVQPPQTNSAAFQLQHPIRLLENLVQQQQQSSRISPAASVFLKNASAHADLDRALKCLDDSSYGLRKRRRMPRRFFGRAAPSISERITRSRSRAPQQQQSSMEIQQQQQQQQELQQQQQLEQQQRVFDFKNAIVDRIRSKLWKLRTNVDELAEDLWEYGLCPCE